MAASECHENTTLAEFWMKTKQFVQVSIGMSTCLTAYQNTIYRKTVPTRDSWEKFYAQIGTCSVYSDDKTVDDLLADLNRATIKAVHIMDGGTQASSDYSESNAANERIFSLS